MIGALDIVSKSSSVTTTIDSLPVHTQLAAIDGAGSGLVSWWKFDEGSGATAVDSTGGSNGTLLNGSTWTSGKIGSAIQLDGVDDYVSTGNSASLIPSTGISISTWIYPTKSALYARQGIFGVFESSGAVGFGFGVEFDNPSSSGIIFFHNSHDSYTVPVASLPALGQWYQIVVTADSGGYRLFINGNQVYSDSHPWVAPSSNFSSSIGLWPFGTYFGGAMDDLRIYNRAISDQEVATIYSGGGSSPVVPVPPPVNEVPSETPVAPPQTTYAVTLSKTGTGQGVITGGSINCGSVCNQSGITSGTSITLTAVPDGDSIFVGWSGGSCPATGNCTLSVSSDVTVTGTFNKKYVNNSGEIIPADRKIDWSRNAGLNFNIPSWSNGRNAIVDDGAKGDGVTDDTASIQDCIKKTPANTFCYLPAGTYKVSKSISLIDGTVGIGLGSKGIRGAGPGSTIIMAGSNIGSILFTHTWGCSQYVNPTSGATKGSTRIYVDNQDADFSVYKAGDLIMIDQENGDGTENIPNYMGRTVGQLNKIIAKGSNYFDVQSPLNYNYNSSFNPYISRCWTFVKEIGIEDMTIDRVSNAVGGGNNIDISNCVNCWIKNIESKNALNWHVKVNTSYGTVVRDSRFEQTWNYSCGGNACYGVTLFSKTSDSLVENNIFKRLRHSMITEYGGTGNIFGFNYSREPINENGLNTDYLMGDMITHGGQPYMNLWEGNTAATIKNDNVLGSSRWNTFFRNNVEVKSLPVKSTLPRGTYVAMFGIDSQIGNLYENYVGNVLGSSGLMTKVYRLGTWQDIASGAGYSGISIPDPRVLNTMISHGNYNSLDRSVIWDSSITNRLIPNSLYYGSRPYWWSGSPWPPVGPDLSPMTNKIPAQICYERGDMPNCLGPAGGSYVPNQPVPINGSCSSTVNICNAGVSSDLSDTPTDNIWSCLGSNGGTSVSCTLAKTPLNPNPLNPLNPPVNTQATSSQVNQTLATTTRPVITTPKPVAPKVIQKPIVKTVTKKPVTYSKLASSSLDLFVPTSTSTDITVPKAPSWFGLLKGMVVEIFTQVKKGVLRTVETMKGLM